MLLMDDTVAIAVAGNVRRNTSLTDRSSIAIYITANDKFMTRHICYEMHSNRIVIYIYIFLLTSFSLSIHFKLNLLFSSNLVRLNIFFTLAATFLLCRILV